MYSEKLVEAVNGGDVPAVEAAVDAGADVNVRLGAGGTLLMRAASEGRLAILQALLRGGADVDARRDDGMTALMFASFHGHSDVVSALLDCGADVDAEDIHKFTALRLASSKCHSEVIRLLEHVGGRGATTSPNAVQESPVVPHVRIEPTRGASEQKGQDRKVIVSSVLPVEVAASEEGACRHETGVEEGVPPPGELSPPLSVVVSPAHAGWGRLLAAGACVVVILFVGFQRTLVRGSRGNAAAPPAPPAVDVGAQPATLLAPPQGQEEGEEVKPAAATPTPPQRQNVAGDTGRSRAAVEPVEPQNTHSPGRPLAGAEPAVVSTAQTSPPPPQTASRPPGVKEAGGPTPAEKAPAVIVVATPRDVPQSSTRRGEPPPMVAPPLSTSTPKKKVIPWP